YAFCAPLAPDSGSARKHAAIALLWGQRTIPLDEGEYILGRDEACRIVVDAEGVSRRHARITVSGNAASIEDLGSKNGTYVNRERISSLTTLHNGDEVALGTAVLKVRPVSDAGATRTVQMP
ncbi:MAG TPA: FHA domain-containing protein, partial [Steroidobacteraceae bacterium]